MLWNNNTIYYCNTFNHTIYCIGNNILQYIVILLEYNILFHSPGIMYGADIVPFRICYCLTKVLCDRSDYVKSSVL